MKMISVDSLITEYLDLTGDSSRLDKARLKKWAISQLEKLPYIDHMVHKIKLLEVEDYKAEKPLDFHQMVQVAYKEKEEETIRREEVVEWTQQIFDGSGCELKITKECPTCHTDTCSCDSPEIILDVDQLIEGAHPEWKYQHMAHFYRVGGLGKIGPYTSQYHPQFEIIGLGNKSSFNQAKSHIQGCINFRKELACLDCAKYTIENDFIKLNKRSGQLLISYLAFDVDEDGYRKIPDIVEVVEAITWFLEERMSFLKYKISRDESYLRDSNMAKQKKLESMGIAREKLNTQDYASFQRDLGKFYGKFLPQEDMCGNVYDVYHIVMSRLTNLS